MAHSPLRFSLFVGGKRIVTGDLAEVAAIAWRTARENVQIAQLVFNLDTGGVTDLDLRGTEAEVATRYSSPVTSEAKRGRPKLGIVSREVTLLPRHWEWLARQSGGASATLRRLVEHASKQEASAKSSRLDAAYRFMSAIAGDLPNFEEASRALFAGNQKQFTELSASWPSDIQRQTLELLNG